MKRAGRPSVRTTLISPALARKPSSFAISCALSRRDPNRKAPEARFSFSNTKTTTAASAGREETRPVRRRIIRGGSGLFEAALAVDAVSGVGDRFQAGD